MRLQQISKDRNSGYGGCQTVYTDLDAPEFCVVQGIEDVPMASLDSVLAGEGAVRIKRSILLEAAARMQAGE